MHPHRTHVPPRPSRSTTAVERPSWPHRIAPTYPAGPPPRKITSYEAIIGNRESGIGNRNDSASVEARFRKDEAKGIVQPKPSGFPSVHATDVRSRLSPLASRLPPPDSRFPI